MSFNLLDPAQLAASLVQLMGAAEMSTNKSEPETNQNGAKIPTEPFDYYSWLQQVNKFIQNPKTTQRENIKRKCTVKGNLTPYAVIAGLAIVNAKKEVTSRDIYRFAKYYFAPCVTSSFWKNSIRNVICTKPLFQKLYRSSDPNELRSYLWSLNPELAPSLFEMIATIEKIDPNPESYGLSDPFMWDNLKKGTAGLPSENIFVNIDEKRKDTAAVRVIKTATFDQQSVPTVSDEDESSSSSSESAIKPAISTITRVVSKEDKFSSSYFEPEIKPVIACSSPPVVSEKEEVFFSSSEGSREESTPIFAPNAVRSIRPPLPRPSPYFIPGKPIFPPGFNPGFRQGKRPFPFGIPNHPPGNPGFFLPAPQFNIIQVNNYYGHPMASNQAPSQPISELISKSFTML